ncbi:uncharacterized protein LY89DRAFT_82751 [Mollisia scopiformis]|uniref:Prolyl 4-hydroxylase alpha subunit domain-containing protein n=1 Tax=Mollisia scopiformis TaxID=149040 RepID=A0A194X899_MOLSC|nr:uncharacterized protein LY89DRAFT_82751 [Mollisia scopiformis]KUJ16391.1 hypothetical protein LY89DRAFT_82751 [Mollisia scopiformis]
MGATLKILLPSLLVLALCLTPLFTPPHVQLQLQQLFSALYIPSQPNIPSNPESNTNPYEIKTHTLSTSPRVIYIENFITPLEAAELVSLSHSNFRPSPLYSDSGTRSQDSSYRSSLTATLPSSPIVKTVEQRARSLPFFAPSVKIKPLVVQKYGLGKEYKDHYDWFLPNPTLSGNIPSTIFVYISANRTGGGTNFPRLFLSPSSSAASSSTSSSGGEMKEDEERWCEFIDCDRPSHSGTTFLPRVGNAVFWQNIDSKGTGIPTTLHAGLPVTSGEKMGMNIWSWVDY